MNEKLKIVPFPAQDISDVARGLRAIADQIEGGEYGDAHNVAWVVDCGSGRVEIGLLGRSSSPGADGHFLFALAQRRLEQGATQ